MIRNDTHFPTLALAATLLLLTMLPFTGCHRAVNKSPGTEAVSRINAASDAKDYGRIQFLADSLGKAGMLSKGESYYWQGYANYHLGHNELAEYYWEEAIRVTEPSTDANDLVYYAKSGNRLASLLCRLGEYASALHQTLPVINRLEKLQCDTTSDYTNLLIFAGCSKTFFDKKDPTATEMLERAYQRHIDNIRQNPSKTVICTRINDALSGEDNEGNMFVTMFLGLLDLETGHLSYCNAGHNPPILGGGDQGGAFVQMLPNAPIGVLPGLEYQGEEIESIKGRPLFVYTDGLNEAENPAHEQYGDERLLDFLRNSSFESARKVIEGISAEVQKHRNGAEPNDDLTMMCLNVKIA